MSYFLISSLAEKIELHFLMEAGALFHALIASLKKVDLTASMIVKLRIQITKFALAQDVEDFLMVNKKLGA